MFVTVSYFLLLFLSFCLPSWPWASLSIPPQRVCVCNSFLRHPLLLSWGRGAFYNFRIKSQSACRPVSQWTLTCITGFPLSQLPSLAETFSVCSREALTLLPMLSFPLGWETRKLTETWVGGISFPPVAILFQQFWQSLSLGRTPWLRNIWVHFTKMTLPFSLLEPKGDVSQIFTMRTCGVPAAETQKHVRTPYIYSFWKFLSLLVAHTQPPGIHQISHCSILSVYGSRRVCLKLRFTSALGILWFLLT